MSIGKILDRTFRIYRDNFIRFVTIVAVIQVPIALLMLISTSITHRAVLVPLQSEYGRSAGNTGQDSGSTGVEGTRPDFASGNRDEVSPFMVLIGGAGMLATVVIGMFGQILCRGALTKSVSESYLGNEITVGQAYRFVWPKFLTLIGAGILVVLIVYLGLLLLVVPGIIFGLWYCLTTPAIVVENLKATEGMSRSKALASGNLGKIFSVGFLVMVIAWVVNIAFTYPVHLLRPILFFDNETLMLFVSQLSSMVAQILVVPIGATAYILLYYDLRIRKEGFDLQMLANSIGSGQGVADVSQPQ
jgi:hypothetical protein